MKKLLIIQLDEAYFLFETLLMLSKYQEIIKQYKITVLCSPQALALIPEGSKPVFIEIKTDIEEILKNHFDLSLNFSMNEQAWPLQAQMKSDHKLGPQLENKILTIPDAWSSYLMTIKARAPFLTFHLKDMYKNILGVKRMPQPRREHEGYQYVAIGLSNPNFFPAVEQEKLMKMILAHHPLIKIKDVSEVDLLTDLSNILYVGPANFDAVKVCENGANGIFLTSQFQGFNLLPHHEGHFLVSSRNKTLEADKLFPFINAELSNSEMPRDFAYSAYKIDEEHLFGSYLTSLNQSDDSYPIYQCHVVLWNFILNLFDVNLEVNKCSSSQAELIKIQSTVLKKLIRLYDYAMSSVNAIHQEAKAAETNSTKIQGHVKNLKEMELIVDNISQTNSFLRPVLDFYKMRRGQNSGDTLLEQAQQSFVTYSEEHQALKALQELFTVTLRKNEVSI